MARDLVSRRAAVIFAGGPAVHAAKAATTIIPIVFVSGEDPVKFGLVASLNRPGGNITGVTTFSAVLRSKRIEMLHELMPNAAVMALLVNPKFPGAEPEIRETQEAAQALGYDLLVLHASAESEIDAAFATLVQQRVGALIITGDGDGGEQRHRSTTDPNPRQYLVLELLCQQRSRRRFNLWLGQLRNNRRSNFIFFADIFGMQHIKRRRKVFVGQMRKLYRDQLTISLGSTSF
jgi:hypothetical protein